MWDGGVATGCVEGWCDAGGSAERVCEGGDAAASAGEGAWGLCEGKSCERAGRLVRGDADDGYTGTVDVNATIFLPQISTTLIF